MLDDLGREAMTAVAERSHLDIISDAPPNARFRDNADSDAPLLDKIAGIEPGARRSSSMGTVNLVDPGRLRWRIGVSSRVE